MPTWDAGVSSLYGSAHIIRLSASENINAGENYSTVTWSLTLIQTNTVNTWYLDAATTWYVNIGGYEYSGLFAYDFRSYDSLLLAATTTGALYHNANGELGITVRAYVSGGGSIQSGDTGNNGWTLTNFDRKPAAPSSVTPTLNADRTITVTSNAVSSPASTAQYFIRWSQSTNGGASWGAWSSYEALGSSRSKTYAVNALAPGNTYRWGMYASNSDGSSAETISTNLFYPSSGKRFDGSNWAQMLTAKRYNGSAWIDLSTAKRYDGSNWVNLG